MLWLPKWLRKDAPPATAAPDLGRFGGLSRREFLYLAGATAIAAAAPPVPFESVPVDAFDHRLYGLQALIDDGTYRGPYMVMHRTTARKYLELLQGDSRYTPAEPGTTWGDLERTETWQSDLAKRPRSESDAWWLGKSSTS
jgi:hypothetical protein